MYDRDMHYMALALRQAERGLGTTWPNPSVGCVLVKDEQIITTARTAAGGRPHAEVRALMDSGTVVRDATMYVSLEPCAHQGQTPPCADAIARAGITRLVCATSDPDDRVAGRGIVNLQAAGLEVASGIREEQARWMAAGHILRISEGRPFVQLKLAIAADGRTAAGDGSPVWVTGPEARAHGHMVRAKADAVLVGSGTLKADDPQLTCRLPGLALRSPIRVLLDSDLRINSRSRLLESISQAPLWVMAGDNVDDGKDSVLKDAGATVHRVVRKPGSGLAPRAVLYRLAEEGITRLLIEGGPKVARSFIEAGLVDEVIIYRSRHALSGVGMPSLVDRSIVDEVSDDTWKVAERRTLGNDEVTRYRNHMTVQAL